MILLILWKALPWALALLPILAWASPASLIRAQPLLAAPDGLAAQVATLPARTPVEVLKRRGGWSLVRAGDKEGWLRILALRETHSLMPGSHDIADVLRDDVQGSSRVVAVAGFRAVPTRPSAHALILTISDYGNGIPPLPGVTHDADSAVLMARSLGVPDANMTALRDGALTLEGMRAALDALEARVMPNDEVFLYYSGHGTRLEANDGRAAHCADALVTADARALMDVELHDRLERISSKARRLVVFLDACFSGGVTTRAAVDDRLTGKFWAKSGAQTCALPSNALTRGLDNARPGDGKLNYIHIAAARNDEVALDDGSRGGLATLAWLDCLSGGARDSNGSSGLSADELAECAQPEIARAAAGNTHYSTPHLTLTGNTRMVLAAPIETPPDPAVVATPPPTATVMATQPVPPSVEPSAVAALKDILANRDDRRTVHLGSDKPIYKIRKDFVHLNLKSSHAGYVYLLMVGSDGKSFDMLFPNKKDQHNHILAGETWELPHSGWGIRAGGPAGRDYLLAIVCDNPRDFSELGMKPAGPFSVVATSRASTRDIQFVSATSVHADPSACEKTGEQRTLEVVDACSDAYGADLITLDESESNTP